MQLALIGFGEAGHTFAAAGEWGRSARAYDHDPARAMAMSSAGVAVCTSARDALAKADLVLSLVTASQAQSAAQDYAPYLKQGAVWCDMNSVAPGTKKEAARAITSASGHYVDAAILAPVDPARLNVPILLAGTHARDARSALQSLGFANVREVGEPVGRASTIKMVRSIMVKGIEALTDEMMQAAEAANIAEEVLASLDASEVKRSWAQRAAYNLERMRTHGERRAEEMEEVAKTLEALRVESVMTRGTVRRQREAAIAKDGVEERK